MTKAEQIKLLKEAIIAKKKEKALVDQVLSRVQTIIQSDELYRGKQGEKGDKPTYKIDYLTTEEIEALKAELKPADGKDGVNGKDADTQEIIRELLANEVFLAYTKAKNPPTANQVARVLQEDENFLDKVKGDKGDKGDIPKHEWKGTKLRFEKPNGGWGKWVDLKGYTAVIQQSGGGNSSGSTSGSGSADFLGLTDTPDSYAGQGGKLVAVKADVSGLEFIAPSAGGAETDPIFTAWDKSTGISITESQISDLGTYLTVEADPIFTTWLSTTPPLYSFTETDPVFGAWLSATPPAYPGDIPDISGLVPYTGATNQVNLADNGVILGQLQFEDTLVTHLTLDTTDVGTLQVVAGAGEAYNLYFDPTNAVPRTITFPQETGTIALTSDIPSVPTIPKTQVGITIDGGGSAITTGNKGFGRVPHTGTITGWTIVADQAGDIEVDVQLGSFAGFPTTASIAGTELPTLTTSDKNENTTLSTWTTAVTEGDIISYTVNSASTVTRVHLFIHITY